MKNQLEFIATYSLDGFKKYHAHDDKIRILKSKDGEGRFFACGEQTGPVSKNLDLSDTTAERVVSKVRGDDGAQFYLLHDQADNNNLIGEL